MGKDREIYRKAYPGCEFLWIVFSEDANSFEGCVVKPDGYETIDRLLVYGDKFKVIHGPGARKLGEVDRDLYSRMLLIPEWDQGLVSNLKVGIVGLGGLGAALLQALVMKGVGENVAIVLVDQDFVEKSNISRIAYATFQDLHRPKTNVARDFVKRARPKRKVVAVREPSYSSRAQRALSTCDFMFGCVDNNLGRECLEDLSASFMVPLLDFGAGVRIEEVEGDRVTVSSGQARFFIPGVTPCLHCNMGLDHEDFDREVMKLVMDEDERALQKKTGYGVNFDKYDVPQPSVYTLNNALVNIGLGLFTRYVVGGGVDCHAVHYRAETFGLEKILAKSQRVCPVCGEDSKIGCGEFFDINGLVARKKFPMPKNNQRSEA